MIALLLLEILHSRAAVGVERFEAVATIGVHAAFDIKSEGRVCRRRDSRRYLDSPSHGELMATAKTRTRTTAADVGARAMEILGGIDAHKLTKPQRVKLAKGDFSFFCKHYLGEYFFLPPARFHRELFEACMTQRAAVIAAPREHAKSTTVTFAAVLHALIFERSRFVLIFRDTHEVAASCIDDLRRELESNERILADFGDLVGQREWTQAAFVAKNGVKVMGRGRGSSARGLRSGKDRPDLVIVDDIESDDEPREQRDKLERWFKRVVLNLGRDQRTFIIGTILHGDGLIARLMRQTDLYFTRKYQAVQPDGTSLWPARWPPTELERKRAQIGSHAFASEFMNEPIDEDQQIFTPNAWRYFRDEDIAGPMDIVAAIDPAVGLRATNDETAYAVVGERDGKWYVLDVVMKRLRFNEQLAQAVSICREHGVARLGVETVAYQDVLRQALVDVFAQARLQVPVVPVPNRSTDKVRRIARLAHFIEHGRLFFPHPGSAYWSPTIRRCLDQFEQIGVSRDGHDDGPDAVERAVSLFEQRGFKRARAVIV